MRFYCTLSGTMVRTSPARSPVSHTDTANHTKTLTVGEKKRQIHSKFKFSLDDVTASVFYERRLNELKNFRKINPNKTLILEMDT